MSSYRLSRKAETDLLKIGGYIAKNWSATQRNVYLKQIDNCFTQLSKNPSLGINCDYIAKGYRKFSQGSHMIYYRSSPKNVIEIIRILHKSMDVESKF